MACLGGNTVNFCGSFSVRWHSERNTPPVLEAHYPYGETRSGAMPTDYQFTGQRRESGLGLYDYNARYYDPYVEPWRVIAEGGILVGGVYWGGRKLGEQIAR